MALKWMEGFEGYGTTISSADELLRKWRNSTGAVPSLETGRTSGYSYRAGSSAASMSLQTAIIADNETCIIGFGFKASTLSTRSILFIYDEDGTEKFVLGVTSAGALATSCTGSGHSINDTTADGLIVVDTWYYIEVKVVFNSSSGSQLVHIDGAPVISETGIDTIAGTSDAEWRFVAFQGAFQTNTFYFDDIYICDGSGSVNNSMLGDCRIIGIFPESDATPNEFDPSSGSDHFDLVNDPSMSESDYLEGDAGDAESFNYTDLGTSGSVLGIAIVTSARKTDTGFLSLATTVDGTPLDAQPVSASLVDHVEILEQDPNTSTPWTKSTLEAAKFGFEAQ